jgi:hypothetical protein
MDEKKQQQHSRLPSAPMRRMERKKCVDEKIESDFNWFASVALYLLFIALFSTR